MADIRFQIENADNPEDDQEDEGYQMDAIDQDESSVLYHGSAEEPLSPVVRMERFMLSDIIVNRQMAARCCQDALRASRTREDVYHVLRLMVRLSDDIEPSVRVELMEQVPHVAVYCYEHYSMMEAVPRYILYIVLRFLTDSNNQVRKTSQAALLVLLEQEVVEREDIEEQVCPVLLQLTAGDSNDDYRSEAIALMSKMASLVGRDISERYFLPRFESLCSDPLFHVRKVCASNFGEMCSILGPEITCERMLPVFFKLCQDGVWGVRKACAECYMTVSTSSPADLRKNQLSQCFISLLCDKSRWVQMAAYQSLGPFISTFADPVQSGFYVNEDGALCQVPQKEPGTPSSPTQTEGETTANQSTGTDPACESAATSETPNDETKNQTERQPSPEARTTDSGYISPPEILSSESELHQQANDSKIVHDAYPEQTRNCQPCKSSDCDDADNNYFNSFFYWRAPLPHIESEIEDLGCVEDFRAEGDKPRLLSEGDVAGKEGSGQGLKSHHPKLSFAQGDDDSDEEDNIHLYSLTDDFPEHGNRSIGGFDYGDYRNLRLGHSSSFEEDLLIADHITTPPVQNVIPQTLLDHYVSMTEPARAQTIDTEIVRHCAFSLPAVALTLGRKNWPCLRDTYELLTSDMQWKVRRTLAFSIHELALVLGSEITRMELLPTFNSFLKDLDEVRIGVLKHLADFIKLLPPDICTDYLPMLTDFLTTDNNRNWRFRFELAEQLMLLSELYKPIQVLQFICPIAISLATDRVADVRTIAFKLIGVLLEKLHSCSEEGPAHKFVCDIINKFAHSPQWTRRQAYAQLCQILLDEKAETGEQFYQEFLPSLLFLLSDPVPNVRLTLSRTLSQSVVLSEYFTKADCEAREVVLSALQRLKGDQDRDVRYFAGVEEEALDSSNEDNVAFYEPADEQLDETCYGSESESECKNLALVTMTEDTGFHRKENDATAENEELLEGFRHMSTEDHSSEMADNDQLESTTLEFEENERRLDTQSDNAWTTSVEMCPSSVKENLPDYSEA